MLNMLLLAFNIQPVTANLPVHNIDTGLDYATIQEAIDAPETLDGHTILVAAGTYYENAYPYANVVINKALTLIGESRSNTIIDGSEPGDTDSIVLIEADNVDMSGFTVTHTEVGIGIHVGDSRYCEVHDNIVCFTGDRGIVFGGEGSNKAYNNIVYNTSAYGGIEAIFSDNNTIFNNEAYFNQWGIATNHGSYNLIYDNSVHDNYGTGIHIDWPSTDNVIHNNDVTSNKNTGIGVIHQANRTVISNNKISESHCGITLADSFANTISGNHIMNNQEGVALFSSENNTIYHNNFIDNTQQVHILPSGYFNIWDNGYPSGGNYWSDYNGIDFYSGPYQNETGSDGIGDIPYVIGENNQDNYPFMEPSPLEEAVIIIGTTYRITVLDPAIAYDFCTWEVFNNIGEGLLKYKPGTAELVYGIAENYTVSPDGLNYTFRLREGLYFTDGAPLNAAAVKWSMDRVVSLDLEPSWLVSDFVDSVEVVDPLTVSFILKNAVSFFPALVATTPYFPVSSESYPVDGVAEPIVGHYGPYKIRNWMRDVELVLEANPDYYGAQPRSKYVVIKFFENVAAMRQALEDRKIDIAWSGLRLTDIVDLRENPDFNIVESHDSLVRYLTLRCDRMPFDDVRLRRAVAAAINRTRICVEAYMGTVDPLYSMVPMGMWSHIDAFKDEYGMRNLNLSRQLLAEAGYSESEKFVFDLWYHSAYADAAAIMKSDLEETGMIDVTLIGASWAEILENMPEGIMQSFLLGWLPDYLDPDNYLRPFVYSEQSPDMGVFYNNTVMDNILDDAIATTNITIRTELYENASRLLAENAPVVPFSQGTLYAVARPNIKGIYLSPTALLPYYTIYKYTPSTRYPWPMFRHDLRHAGYSESPAPNTNQTMWNYTTGSPIWSSPTVADGKVFVQSGHGKIYCFDALTGAHIWNYTPTYAKITCSSPIVADGKVYVGSYSGFDGTIYCLDALTGAYIWNYTTGPFVDSSPAVADGKVYIGSTDGNVYCLDALTGAYIWNYTTGSYVRSSPAVVDGKVYVGSDDNNTYCLDALTGAHIWNHTTGDDVYSSPAVADGKVYVGSHDHNVYCLDALTGAHIWNYTTGDSVRSSPAVADGMVFVGSDDGVVYAFGNVIRVPEDFPTVQEAVYAAESGATIIVAPGIYYESVVINQSVTIIGLPGSEPIFDGGGSGIAYTITGTSKVTITGIVITNWNQAIYIEDSSNCEIYYNIMTSNYIAINLTDSSISNTIYGNTISQNEIGINVANSISTTIYHNNFIGNAIQIYISMPTGNIWDDGYPSGGNYWSDYNGDDEKSGLNQDQTGSDGIGDTEYVIADSDVDSYPLMKPFNSHDVGVISVLLSKTTVGQGFTLNINLTTLNYGVYSEAFTVTIYADAEILGTQAITLEMKNSIVITFTWDTVGFARGNYTITVVATAVLDEVDTLDNTLVDGWILITKVGDFGGSIMYVPTFFACDGKVDAYDLALFIACYKGLSPPEATYLGDLGGPVLYIPTFYACDGKVDAYDLALFIQCYKGLGPGS